MFKKISHNQEGAVMLVIVMFLAAATIAVASYMVGRSAAYVSQARNSNLAQGAFSAWESCLQYFNNETDMVSQLAACKKGQCLDLNTESGCLACGENKTYLDIDGNCRCYLEYLTNTGSAVDFSVAGLCDDDHTKFVANATVQYCKPDCTGRVCGSDGCGGTCPPGCPVGVCDEPTGKCLP